MKKTPFPYDDDDDCPSGKLIGWLLIGVAVMAGAVAYNWDKIVDTFLQ